MLQPNAIHSILCPTAIFFSLGFDLRLNSHNPHNTPKNTHLKAHFSHPAPQNQQYCLHILLLPLHILLQPMHILLQFITNLLLLTHILILPNHIL